MWGSTLEFFALFLWSVCWLLCQYHTLLMIVALWKVFKLDLFLWRKNAVHGLPGGSVVKESTCQAGYTGSIPGSGKSPREGNGNPL